MDGTDDVSDAATPASSGVLGPAQLRELYTGPPGEFVSRRKDLVTALKDAGEKAAARDAAALRKPSTPAWVLNLLAEDGRTSQELLELAGEITAAVAAGERAELRTLAAAQRLLMTDILERATELATGSGTKIPAAAREVVEAAVRGVLTDPSTAPQLFTGVLVELPDPDDADALPELAFRSHPTPKAVLPATKQPTTKQPTTKQPTTKQPTTKQPTTKQPTTKQPTTRQSTSEGPTRSSPKSRPSTSAAEKRGAERAAAAAAERKRRKRAVQEAELVESRWENSVQELEQEQARLRTETSRVQRSLAQARTEHRRAERRAERYRRLLAEPAD